MRKRNIITGSVVLFALIAAAIYQTVSASSELAPAAGCSFANNEVALLAATTTVAGKPEVRLRWMTKRGWVPGITFNLYRVDADQKRARLNNEPLGSKAGAIQVNAGNARVSPDFKYAETLNVASRSLSPSAQNVVDSGPIKRLESAQTFIAMRDTIKQLRAQQIKSPGLTPRAFSEQVMKADGVRPYLETLRKGSAAQSQSNKITEATAEEQTREARSTLQLAALLHPQVARDLGYAFDDQTVLPGATYTYELRSIENGQECGVPLASAQLTVGEDEPLAAVMNLTVAQANEDSVDLRWDRPANEDALSPTYKITRVDSKGSRASSRPIMVADMKLDVPQILSDGRQITHVEPRSFYHDLGVTPGKVTYSLVMTDIFGRESAPASVDFTMEDWHTPDQVATVWAELKGNDVSVSWTPSTDNGVVYRVYRLDAENPNAKPELLTTTAPTAAEQAVVPVELESLLSRRAVETNVLRRVEKSESSSTTSWLAFTDKNVPNDHSYRYLVTAVYKNRNDLDSPASYSRVLPVPVTTLLAGPTNLKGKLLTSAPQSGLTRARLEIKAAKPRQTNYGGVIELTWDSVPGAKIYRVYRANASGYFNATKMTPSSVTARTAATTEARATPLVNGGGIRSRSAETTSQNLTLDRATNPSLAPVARRRDIQLQKAVLSYVDEVDDNRISESGYALAGQVNEATTFYDYFPRSQAHTYAYRVVAVNRWNVPAAGMVNNAKYAAIKVRVPATLPPTTPVLLSVAPDKDGYLQLKIQRNLESEGVVRYHIYRRDMPLDLGLAQLEPALPAGNLTLNPASLRVVHPVSNVTVRPSQIRGRAGQFPGLLFEHNGYQELTTINTSTRGAANQLVVTPGQLTFRDDTVLPLHEYFYYLVADNGEEKYLSKPSNILNGIPPRVRADAPAYLKATPGPAGGVNLNWPATATDAVYVVERAKANSEHFAQLDGASANTSYTDHSVLPGRTYTYRVIAIEKTGAVSDPFAYPLDKPNKNPDDYPAQVKFTVPAVKPMFAQ